MNKQEKLDLKEKQVKYELVMKALTARQKKHRRTKLMISLGKQIQTIRKVRGHKISSLAHAMTESDDYGSTETYLRNIEKGKGNPTIKYLQRIAKALNAKLYVEFIMKADK